MLPSYLKAKLLLLLFFCLTLFTSCNAQVETLEVPSKKMGRSIPASVVLPEGYQEQQGQNYPVLYLLHGYSGDHRNWLKHVPEKNLLPRLASQYNIIIVTPNGGFSSWYLDSPLDNTSQYETFISQELVQHIDQNYRTIRNRHGRFISCLSMGGHGALYLAAKHPELYLAAGSMSGAVDLSALQAQNLVESIEHHLGPKQQNQQRFASHSVVHLVPQLKKANLHLFIDCGTEDFLIEDNRELHRRLEAAGVEHTYIERAGAHTWKYWGEALEHQVVFFKLVMQEKEEPVLAK